MSSLHTVPVLGQIVPPSHHAPLTPEQYAKGKATTTMIFDSKVVFTPNWQTTVIYEKGIHEVPEQDAGHWYFEHHNARPYARQFAASTATKK